MGKCGDPKLHGIFVRMEDEEILEFVRDGIQIGTVESAYIEHWLS